MTKSNMPIFFTESLENSHLPSFEVEARKLIFIVDVDIKKNEFRNPCIKDMNELVNNSRILILGHDLDEQGQIMASIVFHMFMDAGVAKERIIRMPLTEKGIGLITTCYSEEEMRVLKNYYFIQRLYLSNGGHYGIRKMLMLKHLFKLSNMPNHRVVNQNPNGTNSVTYVTKELLGESHVI